MASGKYVSKGTKVIMLGEGLQDFLVINKKQYEYDGGKGPDTTPILETQLVISEMSAETDMGVTHVPAKTLYINESNLRKIYDGLKELFEEEVQK